jgi:Ca2+-transporting ATPase
MFEPEVEGRPAGLTDAEAGRRLAEVGRNELPREAGRSRWRILVGQFGSPLVWLLLGAAAVSGLLGDVVDTIAIGTIVVINALVGYAQEHRAETALLALTAMTAPRARVARGGRVAVVEAAEVVPGDLLVVEAGDVVAADARLVEAHALTANEAALTGESLPVEKTAAPSPPDTPLAERRDLLFMGTTLATGTGRAEVVATGTRTELGHVARLVSTAEQGPTPLERRLARVGASLLVLCVVVVLVVAALGLLRGERPLDVLLSAVSLAVAAVPEGLPAIVTIALAVGVQRMAARHVLVRRLAAVEALGCATVICTDKTGTLTTGVMAVREVWGEDHRAVLAAAAACCDADLGPDDQGGSGDPTEVAILAAAAARGLRREDIERDNPRVDVAPFDSERRWMAIERRDGRAYFKGSVEALVGPGPGPDAALAAATEMAARGLRVLAVAVGAGAPAEPRRARLVGLLGLADPPRTEAIAAVAAARRAGIRTVMITGDHPATALAIGRELGIVGAADDPAEVVHARATPAQKLEIVRGWKARGGVVAMTGDGVNDAPALREAHVGIAMGKTGTEVAREASDMVLADDDYASIVAGVEEGRGVFENIRKSLLYLLSGNVGELLVMLAAAVLGLPLPLLPLQILWVNLVTDGLPALGLVMDPADAEALRRPPRRPDEPMLGGPEWRLIVAVGALHGALTLGLYAWALRRGGLAEARTLAFSTLVFGQLFLSVGFRHREKILWTLGVFTNLRLVAIMVFSALLQTALTVIPPARTLFHLTALSPGRALVPVVAGLVPVTLLELSKLATRARAARRGEIRTRPRPTAEARRGA